MTSLMRRFSERSAIFGLLPSEILRRSSRGRDCGCGGVGSRRPCGWRGSTGGSRGDSTEHLVAAGGDLDRCGAGVCGEAIGGREPAHVAGESDAHGGDDRPHTEHVGEGRLRRGHGLGDPPLRLGKLAVQAAQR